jgi:hypothetical protein
MRIISGIGYLVTRKPVGAAAKARSPKSITHPVKVSSQARKQPAAPPFARAPSTCLRNVVFGHLRPGMSHGQAQLEIHVVPPPDAPPKIARVSCGVKPPFHNGGRTESRVVASMECTDSRLRGFRRRAVNVEP